MQLSPRMNKTGISCPSTMIDPQWVKEIKQQADEQQKVLVHLSLLGPMQYRIWPTTYLFDQHSDHRSCLLHIENLSVYPEWSEVQDGKVRSGLLIFEGLPKTCTSFDFQEIIPESGAFTLTGITRNDEDIYSIEIR